MSNNWKKTILGDLIDIKHGFAFPGKGITNIENQNLLITPGNFEIGGGFRSSKNKYFSGEVDEKFLLSHGEIIVSMTDLSKQGDTLGYSAKIPTNSHYRYLHNQRIGKVICLNNNFHPDFIYWLMRSKSYRHWILSSATGSTVKHTSPKVIKSFEFFLPPIDEQKAIAKILGTLDEKIELNKKTNETLEGISKALFKSWFIDFEPVRAKAEGRLTGLRDEISNLFPNEFEDSELGVIPKGWSCSSFGEFLTKKSEKILDRFATVLSAVSSGELVPSEKYFTKKVHSKNISNYIALHKYDIAYNPSRINIGSIGIHQNDYLGAVSPIYIVVTPRLDWHWFTLMSIKRNYFKQNVQVLATGSVRQSLSINDFFSISVVTPPRSSPLISYFNKFYDLFLKRQKILNEEKKYLQNISRTILPKLISGELKIPNAEKMIEKIEV